MACITVTEYPTLSIIRLGLCSQQHRPRNNKYRRGERDREIIYLHKSNQKRLYDPCALELQKQPKSHYKLQDIASCWTERL